MYAYTYIYILIDSCECHCLTSSGVDFQFSVKTSGNEEILFCLETGEGWLQEEYQAVKKIYFSKLCLTHASMGKCSLKLWWDYSLFCHTWEWQGTKSFITILYRPGICQLRNYWFIIHVILLLCFILCRIDIDLLLLKPVLQDIDIKFFSLFLVIFLVLF